MCLKYNKQTFHFSLNPGLEAPIICEMLSFNFVFFLKQGKHVCKILMQEKIKGVQKRGTKK
jgi:hypothetical protein